MCGTREPEGAELPGEGTSGYAMQNQFQSHGFWGKREVGTTDKGISVPDARF